MKKLYTLLILVALTLSVSAQFNVEQKLSANNRYHTVLLTSDDVVTPTNSISKYFLINYPYGIKYKINVSADSLSVPYSKFIISESTNEREDGFVPVDTILWMSASEDTTFTFDQTGSVTTVVNQSLTLADSSATFITTSRATDFRYLKYIKVSAEADSTGGRLLLTNIDIAVWFEQ